MNDKTYRLKEPHPTCCNCGQPIPSNITYDLWALCTVFDKEDWNVRKTGEDVSSDGFRTDYMVFGECCLSDVKRAWNILVDQLFHPELQPNQE